MLARTKLLAELRAITKSPQLDETNPGTGGSGARSLFSTFHARGVPFAPLKGETS
jgi:hypothetical protein